jgi:hypothetical protein
MGRAQKTNTGLPHPSAVFDGRPMDGRAVAPVEGRGLTAAICGLATLGLALVLGFSIASSAANAPADGGMRPVYIVTRPPLRDMVPAIAAGEDPFKMAGCIATAAAGR